MKTATANQLALSIRWIIRRDWPEVLAIENQCFQFPWDEDAFIRCMRQRNNIGMVCERDEKVIGYMAYGLEKHSLNLLNVAVHQDWRFKGVGRQMVRKLITKLSGDRRSKICVLIRETNVDAQLFFRAMGFKCVQTIRNAYDDTEEDGYDFRYRYSPGA
jgi:ribosomal-protein-alanine N-acetyltransferase